MRMEAWPPPGSFADRMRGHATFYMADFVKEYDTLTLEHIELFVASFVAQRLRRGAHIHENLVTFSIATSVLRFFLGDSWTNQNVFSQHKDVAAEHRDGRAYLRTEHLDGDRTANLRHQLRVTNLASALLSLQGTPGIAHRIAMLKRGDLESGLGELECAGILSAPEFHLRFVVPGPVGRKGDDYDVEFTTAGGQTVCCEVETKKESTVLTENTVYNSIEHARKQLPKNQLGLVFLRIPQEWIRPGSKEIIDKAVLRKLRQTQRIVAVVLAWEVSGRVGERFAVFYAFSEIPNRNSPRYSADVVQTITQRAGRYKNPNWIDLLSFIPRRLPVDYCCSSSGEWPPSRAPSTSTQCYDCLGEQTRPRMPTFLAGRWRSSGRSRRRRCACQRERLKIGR